MKANVMKLALTVIVVITIISMVMLSNKCAANECIDGYTEYKPVYYNYPTDSFLVDESLMDAKHYNNIKFVLEFHRIKYKEVDGKIMVECEAWKNKEGMWNMTNKAKGKRWIKTQKEFCVKSPFLCPDVKQSTLENLELDD